MLRETVVDGLYVKEYGVITLSSSKKTRCELKKVKNRLRVRKGFDYIGKAPVDP
jgi:hypothetical protein